MTKATVVIISSVPWHFTWQRHHDLAHGLAKRGYRVVYIDPLPKRWPQFHEWKRVLGRIVGSPSLGGKFRQEVANGIQIVSPKALPDLKGKMWVWGRWLNQVLFIPLLVAKITPRLTGPVIVINYLPTTSSVLLQRRLQPVYSVYDAVVDWDTHRSARSAQIVERELVELVDIVLADSPYLFEKMKAMKKEADKVKRMLPAVHFNDFSEVRNKKPFQSAVITCAYFGAIGEDIRLSLLECVAKKCKLRLIGPIEVPLPSSLLKNPNVEILPPLPYSSLLKVLKDVDILLLPYNPDVPNVRSVIPAKTFQCLATGKPTVVYGLESLREFGDAFYVAETEEEFCNLIASVSRDWDSRRPKALALAQKQDWERRLDFLEALWRTAIS